jgi:hypothetical protein
MAERTIKLTGKISAVNIDFVTGTPQITFAVNEKAELMNGYDALKDVELLTIEAKPFRKRRSLNANAYAWKLITDIADVLRAPKESVYLQMLKRYGQSELISVLSHIPIADYVKYYEEAGESTLNGKLFKYYRVFKGSSEFDTREMAILIDGIVSEAKELNIPTETPEEIARIKSLWGG